MKHSIKRLPKSTQEELTNLTELILKQIKGCEMIILFGSYARGNYVLWDEFYEKGVRQSYQSDLDILVVISTSSVTITEHQLRNKVAVRYDEMLGHRRHPYPQFIVEQIETLNKYIERSQYFFTDIVKEGVLLYDSKRFELAKPRKLSFSEIKKYAQDEFDIYYHDGEVSIMTVNFLRDKEEYRNASFHLHQSAERFYNAISLVFTNYRPKTHKLEILQGRLKSFAPELLTVFPLNTDFEKRCYDLLCRAYIEARYDRDYSITREELDYLIARVEILKEITYRICTEKIASYGTLIEDR